MHHRHNIPRQVWASFSLGDAPVASMPVSPGPISPVSVTPLAGGLSGSGVWKISSPDASYCLKNMPPGFPVNHLRRIHHAGTLRRDLGMEILAAYLPARHGETYVEADGRLWELQSWQTGTPASGPLTMQQKRHMLQAVAQFHHVVRGTPHDRSERGTSPGIAARNKLVEQWQRHSQASLIAQVDAFGMPHLRPFFRLFIDSFYACAAPLQKRLHALLSVPFPLEDCLGDPRPDNFLFTGTKLTGLIDLSSLRVDNRALDIARLGSELADDGAPDWEAVFQPVEEAAPLTADERRLVWTLDLANILLTGLNWLQWIVVEKRQFSSPRLVTARLHHLERRLAFLSEHPAWNA